MPHLIQLQSHKSAASFAGISVKVFLCRLQQTSQKINFRHGAKLARQTFLIYEDVRWGHTGGPRTELRASRDEIGKTASICGTLSYESALHKGQQISPSFCPHYHGSNWQSRPKFPKMWPTLWYAFETEQCKKGEQIRQQANQSQQIRQHKTHPGQHC